MNPCLRRILALVIMGLTTLAGQTTQGLMSGVVRDRSTGAPLADSWVFYCRIAPDGTVGKRDSVQADKNGFYVFLDLSAGEYRVRAQREAGVASSNKGDCFPPPPGNPEFQAQEKHDLTLAVAARLEVDFDLRPADEVFDPKAASYLTPGGLVIRYFGADDRTMNSITVETAPAAHQSGGSTVSYTVEPRSVDRLPLTGRDIYTALVLQPNVAAGSATGRGLGVSVNGQRPTASNYLLDGLENNNTLITGPLTALAPEMVQEFRISTSSWSAEYGGTAGFVANAITRAGGAAWHGNTYYYLKNEALNANTFQLNAQRVGRLPLKENQYGFQAGGPVRKQTLFVSAGFQAYRSRAEQQSTTLMVPSPLLVLREGHPAKALLTKFPTPATDPGEFGVSTYTARPTVSLDRYVGLARADYVAGQHRVMLRLAVNRFNWPDFVWHPYKDFTSGMKQPLDGVALGYAGALGAGLTHELHAGFSQNRVQWDRPHPEIPTLGTDPVVLPSSPLLYGLRNTQKTFQLNDTWSWVRGRHILKAGGGLLQRGMNNLMTVGQGGRVVFGSNDPFADFKASEEPATYTVAVDRLAPQLQLPSYGRTYRNTQVYLFAEDTWRVTPQLSLNVGVRFENLGSPSNTGTTKDALVQLGAGNSFPERLQSATLTVPTSRNQRLWDASSYVSPRFGFAWDTGSRGPVIRGGYGIFFDRPFDNLWQNTGNNRIALVDLPCQNAQCSAAPLGYLSSPQVILAHYPYPPSVPVNGFPSVLLMDPKLKNGYTQSFFLGLSKRLSSSWDVELNSLAALGRHLLTSDIVNRNVVASGGRYNSQLPDVVWRSSQGSSNYHSLAAVARYRARRGSLQLSYTWSHAIDNQSDPLGGDFFDLGFVNVSSLASSKPAVSFARQFDSSADRGDSDFDQRHNLVFYSWWDLPTVGSGRLANALASGWRFSQMAAFRSGFPYSVTAGARGGILNQRADLLDPAQISALPGTPSAPGSVAVLNPAAFRTPVFGVLGNTGRNAFRGPGLWNVDLSLSRVFPLHPLGDAGRFILRADFFNAFNHANLNAPDTRLGSATFGQASYGRLDYASGFPALVPLNETPRQIQLLVKVEF